MKRILAISFFIALSLPVMAQKGKLNKEDSKRMTQDQRVLYESDRKSKGGKKKMSMKKKVRIDKKQARKAKRMKNPKR
ncbi:MAG TPA: hypothetical protein VFU05_19220 [Cyclobacteriaceae bacterium]|nr:hypothetical protein [Cyclobacteriaceae bacterium]